MAAINFKTASSEKPLSRVSWHVFVDQRFHWIVPAWTGTNHAEIIVTSHGSRGSNLDKVRTATASPTKTSTSETISVEIRGQTLSVRSDHDPEFVRRLAGHIDEKVAEIQENAPSVPLSKLLMLASMTVAEELFEARNELEQLRGSIQERTETMMSLLEQLEVAEDATAE